MRILGIESSCDETSAAVLEDGWTLRSNVIASQAELHEAFGGVVPEIASRRHVELITLTIQQALDDAGVTLDQIEGVAVTNRPGLVGSLLVGVSTAKALALARGLPLAGVHHIEGHIFSSFLEAGRAAVPAVALIASGGHTELYHVRDLHDYSVMGRRRDDAAGEAFDKGARALGLGTGGGAALDAAARSGDPDSVPFPRARTENPLDFSFSGVKSALVRYVRENSGSLRVEDVAASYQAAIVDVLVEHTVEAVRHTGVQQVVIGGGVAANSRLQAQLREAAARFRFELGVPSRTLCTDNAGMIAAVGHSLISRGMADDLRLETYARAPLTERHYEPAAASPV
jgi:N6-L-threonylcarbamoyladenine synthase